MPCVEQKAGNFTCISFIFIVLKTYLPVYISKVKKKALTNKIQEHSTPHLGPLWVQCVAVQCIMKRGEGDGGRGRERGTKTQRLSCCFFRWRHNGCRVACYETAFTLPSGAGFQEIGFLIIPPAEEAFKNDYLTKVVDRELAVSFIPPPHPPRVHCSHTAAGNDTLK